LTKLVTQIAWLRGAIKQQFVALEYFRRLCWSGFGYFARLADYPAFDEVSHPLAGYAIVGRVIRGIR